MATLSCPTCAAPYQPGDLICLDCGANLARVGRRQPPARDDARHGGRAQPPPPHPHQPYPGQQPPAQQVDQGRPEYGQPPYQPPHPDAGGHAPQGEQWLPPRPQGGPASPQYDPAPRHSPQDPYGPAGAQEPYGRQGAHDPYGHDPYAQPGAHDLYAQAGAQEPYGQQGAHDPYAQPGAGAGAHDPYGRREPQDPYGRQPAGPQYPDRGAEAPRPQPDAYQPPAEPYQPPAEPYGHDAYAGAPRDPYGAQPGPPQQPAQPFAPPGRHQTPEPPGVRREETLVPPEEQRPQQQPAATAFMCPHCEAVLSEPGAAQCGVCLRPLRQSTPVLRMAFPTGEVKVSAGQVLVLGRDIGQSPVAATFTQYDNVSRRHSTVRLDSSGAAWVRDERSTNGTFVNGERLPPGVEAPLRDGDTIRLAADATGTVHLG